MRIPDTTQDLWVIVAETDHFPDPLVLITKVISSFPLDKIQKAV